MRQPKAVVRRPPNVKGRALMTAVAVMGSFGCSAGSQPTTHPASTQSTQPMASSNSSPTTPPPNATYANGGVAPVCTVGQLRLTSERVSEATQQESRLLELQNVSHATCDLDGYPGVTLRTADGKRLAFAVRNSGDQMVTSARPRRVELQPGDAAWVLINQVVCVYQQQSAPARSVRLQTPGSPQALAADIGRLPIIAECRPHDPGHVLQVSPVEPTPQAASHLY